MTNDASGESNAAEAGGSRRQCKVDRVIEERGLDGLGGDLERYWTGEGADQYSLRELATYFNHRVLRSALEAVDEAPLDGEAENLYELLTSDEVTSGTRIQTERRLERSGIDVERLQSDFVSHQAIHTYLTKYRNVEHPSPESGDRIQQSRNTVQQLRSRLQAVTETTISTLCSASELSLGEFDVYVDVRVTCNDCQTQYHVTELLEAGRCNCE